MSRHEIVMAILFGPIVVLMWASTVGVLVAGYRMFFGGPR